MSLLDQLRQLSDDKSSTRLIDLCLPKKDQDVSRVIEMAWEDRTPFEAIKYQYNLDESQVIELMRRHLKPRSFKSWRQRVSGRVTKHIKLRHKEVKRAYCPTQYKHK